MKLFLSIILTLFTCWAVSAQQRIYELSSQRKVPFQENAKELIKRFYEDLSECDTDPDFRKAFIKNNVQQNAKLKPDYYSEKEILQYLSCEQYIQGFLGEYKRRMEKAKPVFKQSAYTFSDFYLTSDGLSSYVIVDFDNVMTISGNVVFSNRVSFYCIFPTYNFYSNVLVLQIESKKKESKIISEKNNPSLNISSGSTKELYDKAVRLYNALDYKSAFALFKQLAEQDNNSAAQNYVGYMYQKGYGVTQDHVEAVKWYRKSADQGNSTAMYNMGLMYKNGYGVKKDTAEAVNWFKKAKQNGYKDADSQLKQLGVSVQQTEPKEKDAQTVQKNSYNVSQTERRANEKYHLKTKNVDEKQITISVGGVSFDMVYVEGGDFIMGREKGYREEVPLHSVTLSCYYIGKTEVTQALWKAVMGENPSSFNGDNLPVENVSWNDCLKFIEKLNSLSGSSFRLPTEAEWEYAARGGKRKDKYNYSGSDNVDEVGWYGNNSENKTHLVGQKNPNRLGLYDMSGNVWEWCSNWFGYYRSSEQIDPTGPTSGFYRVNRGGCWRSAVSGCLASGRSQNSPNIKDSGLGFRLAANLSTFKIKP